MNVKECLGLKGKVEIFTSRGKPKTVNGPILFEKKGFPTVYKSAELDFSGCEVVDKQEIFNIILNEGKDAVIESLTTGFLRVVARMAVGDRGTIPTDQTQPKVPTSDQGGLFNEVYRADIETTTLQVGLPAGDTHQVTFIKTFSALEIPITSFSNQANPIINEVSLIMADLLSGDPLPRAPVSAPDSPPADELAFSIRTFKSVPFEAANEISITIRYTIFIE